MLPRKLPPELSPYLCHKLTKDPGVRASKVDVFEDALRCAKLLRETQRRECASVYSRLVNNNHFARLHIANVLGLAQVECARLAGHAVAVGAVGAAASKLADAQGPESVGIADSTHEVVGHEDAREGPLGLGRRIEYLIELRVALRVGDEVKEQFRVDSRLHQHPLVLEEGLELVGVGEVAVVAESKVTHAVANGKGLETLNRILATSCTVARVADCVLPLEVLDVVVLEHVRHKPLPPAKLELGFLSFGMRDRGHHSSSLLATVLETHETIVTGVSCFVDVVCAENAALFVVLLGLKVELPAARRGAVIRTAHRKQEVVNYGQ